MKRLILIALLPVLACAEVVIRLDSGAFRITGLLAAAPAEGWASLISVYSGDADVPMGGAFAEEAGALLFRPRYPLTPGVVYRAVFHPPRVEPTVFRIEIPSAVTASAKVEKMYPSAEVLPANLLRIYLEFSQPIARGEAWKHVQLLRADGTSIERPFLDQELWTQDQRRLTVLIDPGRVKRGVSPPTELGEVLSAGSSYTLVVAGLQDANGWPVEEFRRSFRAGPPLHEGIDVRSWHIFPPAANSREPVTVEFDRVIDAALAQRGLRVQGVAGTAELDRAESRWRFTPTQPWAANGYKLVVDPALEDVAGNRIGRAFEFRGREAVERQPDQAGQDVSVGFEVR